MLEMDPKKSIAAFFAGQSLFVTGASGFMGQILIEKLLWSCPDIKEIFILIRPKKKMSIDERMKKLFNSHLFERIRTQRPKVFDKLIPVPGDVSVVGLGMTPNDRQMLIEKVSIIFHVAASVRFDDSLQRAIFMNTRSAREMCILASHMKKLVMLMHVSSTYTHTDKHVVEEKLYPCDVDWKKSIEIAENFDDHTLRILTPKYMGAFPNTYTFSKRLAEDVVADYAGILPIVVFRPSIVISSMNEPVAGWLDNFNGPVAMMVGAGKGVLRVMHFNSQTSADFMPVDLAIKMMITVAWKRGIVPITEDPSIHVYNSSSSDIKSISMAEIAQMGLRFTEKIPLDGIIWIPNVTIVSNKVAYYLLTLLLHLLPAAILDSLLKLAGKQPMLVRIHRKVFAANNALEYFIVNEWKFKNEKLLKCLDIIPPHEFDAFGFEYATIDIYKYFENCIIGAKKYLLNEDMNKLHEAKVHYDRMYWLDIFLKTGLSVLAVWLAVRWGLFSLLMHSYSSFFHSLTI